MMWIQKNPFLGLLLCSFLAFFQSTYAEVGKLVCFYDAQSFVREGEFCQILINQVDQGLSSSQAPPKCRWLNWSPLYSFATFWSTAMRALMP